MTAAVLLACSSQWADVPLSPARERPEQEKNVKPPSPPPKLLPGQEKLVALAREDLARRLGIDAKTIELVELVEVIWPDGGLGCPAPGMAYKQVRQDGLLMRLAAGGRTYEYHSGESRPPFLCENPAAEGTGAAAPPRPGSE